MTVQLTQEQKDRLIPIIKMEIAKKAQEHTTYFIAKNRYSDLLDTVEDKKYEADKVQNYKDKIGMYSELMDIYKKDIELLESIQIALT